MAIKRLAFGKLWTNREDFPPLEVSEAQVREDYQYHPDAIKTYLNDTLIPALEGSSGASNVGTSTGVSVERRLEQAAENRAELQEQIFALAEGDTPGVLKTARVEFSESSWVLQPDWSYSLTIGKDSHKRTTKSFAAEFRSLTGNGYESGTWDVATTRWRYDEATEDVIVKAESAYSGVVVFYGA